MSGQLLPLSLVQLPLVGRFCFSPIPGWYRLTIQPESLPGVSGTLQGTRLSVVPWLVKRSCRCREKAPCDRDLQVWLRGNAS